MKFGDFINFLNYQIHNRSNKLRNLEIVSYILAFFYLVIGRSLFYDIPLVSMECVAVPSALEAGITVSCPFQLSESLLIGSTILLLCTSFLCAGVGINLRFIVSGERTFPTEEEDEYTKSWLSRPFNPKNMGILSVTIAWLICAFFSVMFIVEPYNKTLNFWLCRNPNPK